MLSPKVFVALEVPLVSLVLSVVDEVHVLHPAFRHRHQGEPDCTENVHNNKEFEAHHENLQVDLRALRQV